MRISSDFKLFDFRVCSHFVWARYRCRYMFASVFVIRGLGVTKFTVETMLDKVTEHPNEYNAVIWHAFLLCCFSNLSHLVSLYPLLNEETFNLFHQKKRIPHNTHTQRSLNAFLKIIVIYHCKCSK